MSIAKDMDKCKLQLRNNLKWMDDTWHNMNEFYYGPNNGFKIGDQEKGWSNEFLVLEHGQVALYSVKMNE